MVCATGMRESGSGVGYASFNFTSNPSVRIGDALVKPINLLSLGRSRSPSFVVGPHFLQASSLASKSSKIIKLGPPNTARTHDLNLVDHRRMQGKDALNALSERNLPDPEGGMVASPSLA